MRINGQNTCEISVLWLHLNKSEPTIKGKEKCKISITHSLCVSRILEAKLSEIIDLLVSLVAPKIKWIERLLSNLRKSQLRNKEKQNFSIAF